ncbi:MAG: hypothetical protein WAW86_02660 [Gammaproteobacteria bacterium]
MKSRDTHEVIRPKAFEKVDKTLSWYNSQKNNISSGHLHLPLCIGFKEPSKFAANFDLVVQALREEQKKRNSDKGSLQFSFTVYLYCNPDNPEGVKKWKRKFAAVISQVKHQVVDILDWRQKHSTIWDAADKKWGEISADWKAATENERLKQFGEKADLLLAQDAKDYLNRTCQNPHEIDSKRPAALIVLTREVIDAIAWCNTDHLNILLHEGKVCRLLSHVLHNLELFGYTSQLDLVYQDFLLSAELKTSLSLDPVPVASSSSPSSAPIGIPKSRTEVLLDKLFDKVVEESDLKDEKDEQRLVRLAKFARILVDEQRDSHSSSRSNSRSSSRSGSISPIQSLSPPEESVSLLQLPISKPGHGSRLSPISMDSGSGSGDEFSADSVKTHCTIDSSGSSPESSSSSPIVKQENNKAVSKAPHSQVMTSSPYILFGEPSPKPAVFSSAPASSRLTKSLPDIPN